jgi:uncharacterized membrane protein
MPAHPAGEHHQAVPDRTPDHDPLGWMLVLTLAAFAGLTLAWFLVGGLEYAYQRIGIPEGAMFGVVFGSLAGSAINIPIGRVRGKPRRSVQQIQIFGRRYRIPVEQPATTTTLAVNLGGAVIPTGVSVFLLIHDSIWWQAAIGIACVTLIVHLIARPVEGVGIQVPGIIPPLLAAGISLLVAPHMAAPVAYVSGSLGTLIGADLLNINKLSSLGRGVASIGGAGTFDGVFLSGIVAVLLVAVA